MSTTAETGWGLVGVVLVLVVTVPFLLHEYRTGSAAERELERIRRRNVRGS